MGKSLCLLHANCQGDAIRPLLQASPEFFKKFHIKQYVNFTKEKIAPTDLAGCDLFLYQHLGPEWGELSSEALLSRLPASADAICLPNFFFKGYWPFWTDRTEIINFADTVLEDLLARELPPEAVMLLYEKADRSLIGDVEKVALASLAREKEKEGHTPIKYTHIIESGWRTEQLFLTVNHPGERLIFHMANSVLKMLGMRPLGSDVLKGYQHPQGEFWQPIHPVVGERLSLPFATRERKYPCFGAEITHSEYVRTYLACRLNGFSDLLSALASRARKINQAGRLA